MKIFIGADHQGYHLKASLVDFLRMAGYEVSDDGDRKLNPDDDFPVFAHKVVADVLAESNDSRGILICGGGQGMAMAANRFKGIRAAVIWNIHEARMTRNDNDSNVLCLPASVLKSSDANSIVETWLKTPFAAAPRFIRRNNELDQLG